MTATRIETRTRISVRISAHIDRHGKIETDKLMTHALCILAGLVISATLSSVPATWAIHLCGVLCGVPSIVQEIIDRFIKGF
jgi:hypothetical protein